LPGGAEEARSEKEGLTMTGLPTSWPKMPRLPGARDCASQGCPFWKGDRRWRSGWGKCSCEAETRRPINCPDSSLAKGDGTLLTMGTREAE